MKVPRIRNRFLLNALRLIALVALLGVSGAIAGLALGVPVGRINFATSKAVRLDQSRLAGTIDPEAAIATSADIPVGWKAGDPAAAAFGILGSDFCGEAADLPRALTDVKSSVFVSPNDDATLITQAVRVEQWQSAKEYVRGVERIVDDCEKFFQAGLDGKRIRINVKEGQREAPITDFVSRSFVADDGSGVQNWSIMAVGDVVIGVRYISKAAPQHSFMTDLQNHILMRIAPQTFAPDSGDTRSNPAAEGKEGSSGDSPSTSLEEGGSADEPVIEDDNSPGSTIPDAVTPDDPGSSGDGPRD